MLVAQSYLTLCHPVDFSMQASLSIILKLMSIESVMPSNHLILCHPLLLCLQFFPASVQFSCSVMSDSDPMNCSTRGLPIHHQLLECAQTHVHQVGDAIQPSHPLLSPSPPALNLSIIRVFSIESPLRIRWPKDWSVNFSISPSNEHPGLISFRMDWSDLLAVQGTLKSLLQHHSSKTLMLRCSALFIVQLFFFFFFAFQIFFYL